ncbi:beige protein [Ceratobasidium sp. AG-Ba]|nr:beige protein [Ceratobasidium sp. AG-Ba]
MLNRRLFHFCMEIITRPFRRTEPVKVLDSQGNMRLVLYELCIYGADLEEQCHIAGISWNACPHGGLKGKSLAQLDCPDTQTSKMILERIKKTEECCQGGPDGEISFKKFLDAGKQYDLNGVQRPFWRLLPNFDISQVLSPDLLHGFHKAFGDHIEKWNRNALGSVEYDTRLKAQVPVPGERSFKEGVTKLKQLSVKDHKALGRVHVPIVANAGGGANGQEGNRKLVVASRAFVHCLALAQLPVHTEKTISEYRATIKLFHKVRDVWIEKGWKLGGKGNLIADWAIPKIHVMGHAPDHIQQKGSMDNFNTETMERLHIPVFKEGYKGSNRKGYL